MDPALVYAGVAFIGSTVAQKCADAVMDAAWTRIADAYRSRSGEHAADGPIRAALAEGDAAIVESLVPEARLAFEQTSALRRAKRMESVLDGAKLLWIDDHPQNNEWEAATLRAFGAEVTPAVSTAGALELLEHIDFDVIISDIARGSSETEGIDALPAMTSVAGNALVIYYCGCVLAELGIPPGAFGIADRPDELLHLVLDVLERHRL